MCHFGLSVCLCELSEIDLFIVWSKGGSECVEEVCESLCAIGVKW